MLILCILFQYKKEKKGNLIEIIKFISHSPHCNGPKTAMRALMFTKLRIKENLQAKKVQSF